MLSQSVGDGFTPRGTSTTDSACFANSVACVSLKDLGKLIANLKENYPGQIDMREVADLAKKNLK